MPTECAAGPNRNAAVVGVSHPPRLLRVVGVIAAALLGAAILAIQPQEAEALIGGVVPMNEFEEPTDSFTTANALLAFVTVDPFGGRVCVVPETTTNPGDGSLSCDGAASWASPNFVSGIGSQVIPVKGPALEVGTWKLLGDSSGGDPDALSIPFTVSPCLNCDTSIAQSIIDDWKAAAQQARGGISGVCTATALYSLFNSAKKAGKQIRLVRENAPAYQFVALAVGTALGFSISAPFSEVTFIKKGTEMIQELSCAVRKMYDDIIADPSDPNFGEVAVPRPYVTSASGDPLIDSLSPEFSDVAAFGEAQRISFERYFGAVNAGNSQASALQADAIADFGRTLVESMRDLADGLRAFGDQADADPNENDPVTTEAQLQDTIAIYQRVRQSGFTSDELQQLQDGGLSAAEIAVVDEAFDLDIETAPVNTSYTTVLHDAADRLDQAADVFNEVSLAAGAVAATINATTPPNQAPVANSDALTTNQDTPGSMNVLANDSDADGDALTVSSSTDGAHGTVTCAAAGTCTYTPAAGYTGPDAFTYIVSDGNGGVATGSVSVTVSPVLGTKLREITAANPQNCSPFNVGLAFDGTNLLVSCVGSGVIDKIDPADGSLVGQITVAGESVLGALSYDRGRGKLWACTFGGAERVMLIDPADGSEDAEFASTGCGDGLAYDGDDDTLWAGADQVCTVTHYRADGTVIGASDVCPLIGGTGKSGIAVGGGKLYVARPAGSQVYEVEKDFSASSLLFQTDRFLEDLECDDVTFAPKSAMWVQAAYDRILTAIEIPAGACPFGGGNTPPVAADDTLTTQQDTPGTVNVLTNDSDPDGDPLAVIGSTDGAHGGASCTAAGDCTYTPAAGYTGPDSFTYTISDGHDGADTATVNVTVVGGKSTSTTYTGASSVQYSDPVTLSGTLLDTIVNPNVGIAGKQLDFTLGTQSKSAGPTAAGGSASTSLVVTQQPGSVTSIDTAFAGDASYLASSDSDPFTIAREDCTLSYSGDLDVAPTAMTNLAADLSEPDATRGDRSNKTVVFTVMGVVNATPQVFTTTTDSDGHASMLVPLGSDVYAVSVAFSGDSFYLSCATTQDAVVTVEQARAKVTGGGWTSIGTGRTNFGFNAIPEAGGLWKGQFQLRSNNNKSKFHSGSVSTLSSSGNSATWSGTGTWNGQANYTYTISVVDNGPPGKKKADTISITITSPTGVLVHSTGGLQTLKGGNVTVH